MILLLSREAGRTFQLGDCTSNSGSGTIRLRILAVSTPATHMPMGLALALVVRHQCWIGSDRSKLGSSLPLGKRRESFGVAFWPVLLKATLS